MRIKIAAYGELKFYTPGKTGFIEMEFDAPKVLSDILNAAGIPLEYLGPVTIDKATASLDRMVGDDSDIHVYPMASGG